MIASADRAALMARAVVPAPKGVPFVRQRRAIIGGHIDSQGPCTKDYVVHDVLPRLQRRPGIDGNAGWFWIGVLRV
jgi:hypothetical protein